MRLIGRNDLFLLLGLSIALFAIVSRPLARVLDAVRAIEQSWGLQLLPGLVILAVVFMFHQVRKRHEMRAQALEAAAEARQATARAVEMERLVDFGKALGESLTFDAIRAATKEHLPALTEDRRAWALIRRADKWRELAASGDIIPAKCEAAARLAVGDSGPTGINPSNDICFPMIVAGAPMGVVGVAPDPPIDEHQRIVLAAAAALLGVSLKNAELFEEIRENSVRDALTGCFNRQHALEVFDAELRRARRSKLPLALIMLDLDHFKEINDKYGHLCGDAVLAAVGRRMTASLRTSDIKCRYGGEEFLVLLPDTAAAGAQRVAEILRSALEQQPVPWHVADIHVADIQVTASLGLTSIVPGELDATAIIARADAALYRAKQQGRNRVCLADEREAIA